MLMYYVVLHTRYIELRLTSNIREFEEGDLYQKAYKSAKLSKKSLLVPFRLKNWQNQMAY
jgi:hypothetical protein